MTSLFKLAAGSDWETGMDWVGKIWQRNSSRFYICCAAPFCRDVPNFSYSAKSSTACAGLLFQGVPSQQGGSLRCVIGHLHKTILDSFLEAAARVRRTKRSRNWTHGSAIPPRSIMLRLAVGGGSRPDCQWCCGSPIGSEVPSSVPQTVVTIGGSAAG
jgi:hypothetical protein